MKKALWIFSNIRDAVNELPEKYRGQAWKVIIEYGFGAEIEPNSIQNKRVRLIFSLVRPLLRLRGCAGSQNGISNNISGLAKNKEPNIGPNIGANIGANPLITETITETVTETVNNKYIFEGKVIKLVKKDWDKWEKAFPELNLYAECLARDAYLAEQPKEEQKKWFISSSRYFIKQNELRMAQHSQNDKTVF